MERYETLGASPLKSEKLPPKAGLTELGHRINLTNWRQDLRSSVALVIGAAGGSAALLFFFGFLGAIKVYGNEVLVGVLAFNALVGLRLSLAVWTGRPDLEQGRSDGSAEAVAAVGLLALVGIHYFLAPDTTLFQSFFICAVPFGVLALAGTTIYDRSARVYSIRTFLKSWLVTFLFIALLSFIVFLSNGHWLLSKTAAYLGLLAAMSFLMTSVAWLRSVWFFRIVPNWRIPLFEAGVGFALLCLFGAVIITISDGIKTASDAYLKIFPFGILATALLAHLVAAHHAHWLSSDDRLDGERMRLWKARWTISLHALRATNHPEAIAYRRTLLAIPVAYGVGYLVLLQYDETRLHPGPFVAAFLSIALTLGLFRILGDIWSGRAWISPLKIVRVSGQALLNWLCYNKQGVYAAGLFHCPFPLFRPCMARRAAFVACVTLLAAPIVLSPIDIKIKEILFGRSYQPIKKIREFFEQQTAAPVPKKTPDQEPAAAKDKDQQPSEKDSLTARARKSLTALLPEKKTPPGSAVIDGVQLTATEKTYYDAIDSKEGKERYLKNSIRPRREREAKAQEKAKKQAALAASEAQIEEPTARELLALAPSAAALEEEMQTPWRISALAVVRFLLLKLLTVICAAILPALFIVGMTIAIAGRTLASFEGAIEEAIKEDERKQQEQLIPWRSPWDNRIDRIVNSANDLEREHLYLGRSIVDDAPIWLHLPMLKMHAHIVGDSGSGKTALGVIPLMSQLIARSHDDEREGNGPSSTVIIDLKGDMALFETARLEAERAGLPFKWFTNVSGLSSFVFNPLAQGHWGKLTANQKSQGLAQALSLEYGEGYGRGHFSALSEGVITRTFERFPEIQSFTQLRKRWATRAAFEVIGDLEDWKESKHLLSLIGKLAQIEPLNVLPEDPTIPNEEQPQIPWRHRIDMDDVFDRSQVVFFSLASLLEPTTVSPVAKLAVMALLQASALRSSQKKNQVYVFIDEFQRILSENISVMMEQARSMKIAFILSNQTLSQLDQRALQLSEIIESCTAFKQVFRASDLPTLQRLEAQSGMAIERRIRWKQGILADSDIDSMLDPNLAPVASTQGPVEMSWSRQTVVAGNRAFSSGRGTASAASEPDLASRMIEVQENVVAKFSRNEILQISSQPMMSLVKFTEDSGFVQYGGQYVGLACEYPMPWLAYKERSGAVWPAPDERTILVGKPPEAPSSPPAPPPAPQGRGAETASDSRSGASATASSSPAPAPAAVADRPPSLPEIERQLAGAQSLVFGSAQQAAGASQSPASSSPTPS